MPDTAFLSLTPDGRVFTLPLTDDAPSSVEVAGTFTFAENGKRYDALYTTASQTGEWTARHHYLEWTPQMPPLEKADTANHRYVFRIPPEWKAEGKSVGVRVNVDKFVEDFLMEPSKVRASLSGGLKVTVTAVPLAAPLLPRLAWTALPAALVVSGVALVIKRRMALGNLSYDLQQTLRSLERKHHTARAAVGKEHRTLFPLTDKLAALREGAFTLARQIQKLRSAQHIIDRRALEADIERLEEQLATLSDESAKRDGEITLNEKRKTLTLLDEMRQSESRCAMRLTKIEAILDATCLALRSAQAQQSALPAEETLRLELDAEVTAIKDVTRDLQAFEELRAQVLAQRAR